MIGQRGFVPLLIVLIIGVLSAGIVGGAWFYKNKYLKKPQLEDQPKSVVSTSNTPAPVSNLESMTDWKTFSGEVFTFKYPTSWKDNLNLLDAIQKGVYNPASIYEYEGNGGAVVDYREKLYFSVLTIINKIPREYVDEQERIEKSSGDGLAQEFQRSIVSFKDQKAEAYHIGGMGTEGWYLVFGNGKILVQFGPLGEIPKEGSLEYKILSTFKFADDNTYISPDGSFSVVENLLGDYRKITIKDKNGKVLVDDVVAKKQQERGVGEKFKCRCLFSFKEWNDNDNFIIRIVDEDKAEYEYVVDALTGEIYESSFIKIK